MVTAIEAARELQKRRAARKDIIGFAENIDVPGRSVEEDDDSPTVTLKNPKLAAHHKLILRECDAAAKRDTGRLMLFLPPGSAKSTYASIVFSAHYLGEEKDRKIILASYGDTLSQKLGKRTRNLVKQPRYKGIYETGLTADSAAMDNWTLDNGSEYMSCGILSGVTGNRADVLIIDDPIKGREQANSQVIRNKTFDAYQDDLLTRLKPGGSVILIQTRWHEDDLAGRILPEGWRGESGDILCKDGNVWRVVCVQAECRQATDPLGRKEGEYLWPEWFTQNHWNQYKVNPRTWGSLYQQVPSPLDGDMFTPMMITVIDALPHGAIKWIRGWDLAATEGSGDYTRGLKLGRHEDGRYIISDLVGGQLGTLKRDTLIKNTAALDGRGVTQDLPQDPGQAGKSQVLGFGKLLDGYHMLSRVESGDKETRAEGAATQVNAGNVYMLRADWNAAVINELRGFPNGTYDDIVDAFSRAYNRLLELAKKMRINKKLLAKYKAKGTS